MDKFQAHIAIVTNVRAMAQEMPATWLSESSWADVVQELAGVMYDLKGALDPRQQAVLMSASAMAFRQAQAAQLVGDNTQPFDNQRGAAFAILKSGVKLSRKAGSFLGQCVVDPTPLTEKQHDWLCTILARAELPPLSDGGDA